MRDEVRMCVAARTDFFEKYYTVPSSVQTDLDKFISEINTLGENSDDASAFEANFTSSGLSERFNTLITRCTPKPYKMTAEDKKYSRSVAMEMLKEDKNRIIKDALKDAAESVQLKAESDLITYRNRTMSDAGILDDYTRLTNNIENAAEAAGFLGKLFKKKKK